MSVRRTLCELVMLEKAGFTRRQAEAVVTFVENRAIPHETVDHVMKELKTSVQNTTRDALEQGFKELNRRTYRGAGLTFLAMIGSATALSYLGNGLKAVKLPDQ